MHPGYISLAIPIHYGTTLKFPDEVIRVVELRFCEVRIYPFGRLHPGYSLFVSEVFVIVSLTLFLPICLEQFARDNGRLLPDRLDSCRAASTDAEAPSGRCVVKIGWLWIDTASFRYA